MSLAVLLVSPQGAGNLGSVARLMMNFGFSDLRIVQPRCEVICDESRKMSMKAFSILENANIYESLPEAQKDLHKTFALAMDAADDRRPIFNLPHFFKSNFSEYSSATNWGFVFGREDSGLTAEEIRLCDLQIQIPSEEAYPSLNLASAVALVLSQFYFLSNENSLNEASAISGRAVPKKEDEEIFFEGLEVMLKSIGFFSSNQPKQIMLDLRDVYHRANLNQRELRIFFGILADLEWRLEKKFFRN